MKSLALLSFVTAVSALSLPSRDADISSIVQPRQSCDNTPTSRSCWGEYSIDTNYYDTTPDTGVVSEHWLSVVNVTCYRW